MRQQLASALKIGLERTGHYGRVLERSTFPGVVVVCYHGLRADDWPEGSMPFENYHLRASTFGAHCAVLREWCHPISLEDWRAALSGGPALPPRPVLITFDDGYRSVFTIGAPILAALDLPAVVFACTEPIERRTLLWFDSVAARDGEEVVEAWKSRDYDSWLNACVPSVIVPQDDPRALMTPQDIAALSRQRGIEIGAHTARHPILSRAAPAVQRNEIATSRAVLEEWTGAAVRAFAYPNGRPGVDYGAETVEILRDLHFDFAFSTRPAFATATEPPLERSRFMMVSEVTAPELAHRLAYSWER